MKTKQQIFEDKVRKIVKEELMKEGSYYRASKKSIGNELYTAMKSLNTMYNSLKNGNDFDPKELDAIIAKLNAVKNSSKEFKSGTTPDEDYD